MKTILISITAFLSFAFTASIDITGRWETMPSEKGNITGVVFKNDNTFEGYVNKKPFVSGSYSYNAQDSTLTFKDNGCNGIPATYKIDFFSNSDSLRFVAISDSCMQRKEGMQRLVMGRVKR